MNMHDQATLFALVFVVATVALIVFTYRKARQFGIPLLPPWEQYDHEWDDDDK